jgi:hypothetical protein
MILRPLDPPAAARRPLAEAWPVVERLQRQKYESCWMITQPSHAALSGEIAARLAAPNFPKLDEPLIRCIALHDAGWGPLDAQAIVRSSSHSGEVPGSFLQTEVTEFLSAWEHSIEIAQKVSAAGGYMVSRHFTRIAEQRLAHGADPLSARKRLKTFLGSEGARQKKLSTKQSRPTDELERLTDVLQLCDLLSLYTCSGARESVELPEYFGIKAKLTVNDEHYRLEPPLVQGDAAFSVAALRYPRLKSESARQFRFRIE